MAAMQFNKMIGIGNFVISEDSRTFIIAEAGVNHNGDVSIAKKLIDCAAKTGVNAVKFQAYKTDQLILKEVTKASYQAQATGFGESQFDMLSKLEITKEQHAELKDYCEKMGLIYLVTPYDECSLEEIDTLDLCAYKVASTDITNPLFLKKIAKRKKPIILSTGMAYFYEIKTMLNQIYPINRDIILLQCTTSYPAKDNEVNLNMLKTYKKDFDILVGYSDHSVGIEIAPYAVALGAKIVEKHFTLNKNSEGPDHKASLEPDELKQFVLGIRKVEEYLGSRNKVPTASESETRRLLQKRLVAAKRIKKGDIFTERNVTAKRTGGTGLSPLYIRKIIGLKAGKDYVKDEVVNA